MTVPQGFSENFTIDDFCDKQKIQAKKFKTRIIEEWIPRLTEIYHNEVSQQKNDM